MLTFFRRIRLRLMNQAMSDTVRKGLLGEGATSKYILYAIGEIALVVIGILIALQINNWNETIKSRQIEQQLLAGLKTELQQNILGLEETLLLQQSNLDAFLFVLKMFNEDLTLQQEEKVDSQIAMAKVGATFNPKYGLLKSIISSGKINYIQNQQLVTHLSSFEDNVVDATEGLQGIFDIWRFQAAPMMSKYVPFNSSLKVQSSDWKGLPISRFPSDNESFFKDRQLESRLSHITVMCNNTVSEERELLSTMESMISLIDSELNNK